MNLREHIKINKKWWYTMAMISFIISTLFPVNTYKKESPSYNIFVSGLGMIFGGIVLFLLPYLISSLLNKKLSEYQIKIILIICFSIFWILGILSYYNNKIN